MIRVRHLVIVLLAGSVWGISEALGGGYLYAHEVSYASVYLSVVGLLFLSLARFLVPIRGSSLVLAAVAIGYRWLNVGYYPCHIGAILCFGGTFEILASSMGRERLKRLGAQLSLGGGTGLVGYGLFAAIMALVVKDPFWAVGSGKVSGFLVEGLAVALLGLALVPGACRLSRRVASWVDGAVVARPAVSFGLSAVVLLACWLGLF